MMNKLITGLVMTALTLTAGLIIKKIADGQFAAETEKRHEENMEAADKLLKEAKLSGQYCFYLLKDGSTSIRYYHPGKAIDAIYTEETIASSIELFKLLDSTLV